MNRYIIDNQWIVYASDAHRALALVKDRHPETTAVFDDVQRETLQDAVTRSCGRDAAEVLK